MNNKFYEVALSLAPRVGDQNSKQLISYLGSAEQVLKTPTNKLIKIPGIGAKTAEGINNKDLLSKADKIINTCLKQSVTILYFKDDDYPAKLKEINDSPSLLYCKGNIDFNSKKSLAIVGTREATRYGKEQTENLISELKQIDCTVISGLAYGIDITAHKKCLDIGLPTYGVMANGIDMVYPWEHSAVAEKMLEYGGLITENPPGSKPDAPKFPARNRIIAGMSDATIVIEGTSKGGALITAEVANSYHREVFAVPGNINANYSKGCNQLIRDHKAHIYTEFSDLTSIMNWGEFEPKKPQKKPAHLTKQEEVIYDFLLKRESPCTIDEISRLTQISILELMSLLLKLEFENIIRTLPGNEYEIK